MEYDIQTNYLGTKRYYKKGTTTLHREDGPAVEYNNGTKEWWINGLPHRIDGPALDYLVVKKWYFHGKRHRKDGPAVEWKNGDKEWYINGERLSREKEAILNKWWNNKNGI